MLAQIAMTERDVIVALAWIIGIGTGALGTLLWALAKWIVGHIGELRSLIAVEMRAFDVRLAKLETLTGIRRHEEDFQTRRHSGDD